MSERMEYSDELARAFCLSLAELGAITKVCALEGMPSRSTVYEWVGSKPEFQRMMDLAWVEVADSLFEELDAIVNEEPPKDEGGRVDHGWVRNKEVRVKAIHWKLARLAPGRYGERKAMEITGANGTPLVPSDELTPARMLEGARRLAFILHQADALGRQAAGSQPLRLAYGLTGGDSSTSSASQRGPDLG